MWKNYKSGEIMKKEEDEKQRLSKHRGCDNLKVDERWRLTCYGRRGIIVAEESWKRRNCEYVELMGWRFYEGKFIFMELQKKRDCGCGEMINVEELQIQRDNRDL